jgi:hypothetical protein
MTIAVIPCCLFRESLFDKEDYHYHHKKNKHNYIRSGKSRFYHKIRCQKDRDACSKPLPKFIKNVACYYESDPRKCKT